MKAQLLKALKQIPQTIVTTAKKEIGSQISLVPLKAQIHLEQKLKDSLTVSINEYKDIPQQIAYEFKRQSTHQNRQPFQDTAHIFNSIITNHSNKDIIVLQSLTWQSFYISESNKQEDINNTSK